MKRKWWTLTAVSVATFMLLLDITVVNVALPSIRDDLGASFTDLQWVVDAYALTLAALVLTVPIGIGAIAITYLKVRESRDPNATRVDWPGVATFSAALFLLVLALV